MKHFKQDISYLSFQFSKTYESDLLKSEYLAQKIYSLDETSFMIEHS